MKAPVEQASIPDNPYVGPHPFVAGQDLHGRRRETAALADLLISKRIALLVSPSGAGKTSLIQAALLPRLAQDLAPLPVVRLDRVYAEAPADCNRYLLSALFCLESRFAAKQRLGFQVLAGYDLETYLAERAIDPEDSPDAPFRLLVIDQLEELFTLDRSDWAEKEAFLQQLGQALRGGNGRGGDADSPLWCLLSMREDYMAELEPYLERIPTGLAFRYRLEPLKREQAIEAVMAPAAGYFPRDAAERLIDDLSRLPETETTEGAPRRFGRFIEPVQLQVVCLRLWDRVVAGEARPIAVSDLATACGGEVASALTDYYNSVMDQAAEAAGVSRRELMDWTESRLISSNKIRTRVLREPGHLNAACRLLVDRHLLRVDLTGEREWVELAHDRLVDPVLNGNQAWRDSHLHLFQRQAKLWAENARADDMLFAGERLDAALGYAFAHANDLTDYDRDFLERSQHARSRADAERERVRQIETKNAEIKRKNAHLRAQRTWISALGAISFVTLIGVAVTLYVIDDQNKRLEASKTELTDSNQRLTASETRLQRANKELWRVLSDVASKNLEIKRHKIQLGFAQANGWERGGAPTKALPGLLEGAASIDSNDRLGNFPELDLRLIQVLGGTPPIERLIQHRGHVIRALMFTADGKHLYSAGFDDAVTRWSLEGNLGSAAPPWSFTLGSDVYGLAYHPERELMACTDSSGNIALWDISGDKPSGRVNMPRADGIDDSRVAAAVFSPDGRWLTTAGKDKRIQLWDISDPKHPAAGPKLGKGFHQSEVYSLAYIIGGPYDGHLVSGDWSGRIGVWKVAGGAVDSPVVRLAINEKDEIPRAVYSLTSSPDGRWLVAGDHLGRIQSWKLKDDKAPKRRRLSSTREHWGPVFDMAFSNDGSRLVSVGADGALVIWRFPIGAKNGTEFYRQLAARRIDRWGEKLYSLAFAPGQSNQVAVGGARSIWLVDIERANPLSTLIEPGMATADWPDLSATPDLGTLAALNADRRTVRLWRDQGSGFQPLAHSINTDTRIDAIVLSPNGRTLITLDCDTRLDVWHIPSRDDADSTLVQSLPWPDADASGASAGTCAIAYSPAADRFATARGDDLTLWIRTPDGWWAADQRSIHGQLLALDFDPTGAHLATAGTMKRIQVWDIESGGLGAAPKESESPTESTVIALTHSPDGGSLITTANDLSIAQWLLPDMVKSSTSNLHFRRATTLGAATSRETGAPMTLTGDLDGQLIVCLSPIDDEHCSQIGASNWGRIDALALGQNLDRMVVSNRGIWVWDLNRERMLETARRLSPGNEDRGER